MTFQLSLGEVAALINVAIVLAQVTFPLLLSFVTIGLLDNSINVATWSVLGRLINSSHWPTLLGTDTSSDRQVLKRVRWMSWLSTLATILLAVAAAITPLGLHMEIQLIQRDDTPFTYVKDTSAIGQATFERDDYHTSRLCGSVWTVIKNCPGDDYGLEFTSYPNGSVLVHPEDGVKKPYISTEIAANISDVFTSVNQAVGIPNSVAGIFDIEYRTFLNWANKTQPVNATWINQGRPYTQGTFEYFQPFILNSKVEAVEGLLVSTSEVPGIGFRNHSLPPASEHGYTWTEEILWMEPETVCTDLNISLDYTIPVWDSSTNGIDAHLTDRGGLVSNPVDFPTMDITTSQKIPRLRRKSYGGAVLTNSILTGFLNETKYSLRMGKRYPIDQFPNCGLYLLTPNKIALTSYGSADKYLDFYSPDLPGALGSCTFEMSNSSAQAANVWNIITDNYYPDVQNFSRTAIAAGLLQGAAIQLDENGDPLPISIHSPSKLGKNWSQPFYSCASAVKASVKTISFEMQGEAALENLNIREVKQSTTTTTTWAIENTGWDVPDINPLWGLISKQLASHMGISTFETPELYLPAGRSATDGSELDAIDATAGISAPLSAMANVYSSIGTDILTNGFSAGPTYSGQNNWPLLLEWSRLGRNASTAGRIIDLIWTDMMANLVVGTKSLLPRTGTTPVLYPAAEYVSVVAYDWNYAALSLIFASLYLVMLIALLLCCIFKRCNFETLRAMLNQTAAGRSITTERFGAINGIDFAKNKLWAEKRGNEPVLICKDEMADFSPHLIRLISKEKDRS